MAESSAKSFYAYGTYTMESQEKKTRAEIIFIDIILALLIIALWVMAIFWKDGSTNVYSGTTLMTIVFGGFIVINHVARKKIR
jgi:hypothetical protein